MKWIEKTPKRKFKDNDSVGEKLAKIRGIKPQDINEYLNPTEKHLHDPSLLKNVKEASARIAQAIVERENIIISSDNDADGVTATAIIYRAINELWGGEEALLTGELNYIYAQRNWGHGIKNQLERVKLKLSMDDDTLEDGKRRNENVDRNEDLIESADLLIIVDSSSNDVETLRDIQENGTDVIVLDHHGVDHDEDLLEDEIILVNPNQMGCEYPNKHLSGAGVVYKVIKYMNKNESSITDPENDLYILEEDQFLDLVAVGLYADMMDMSILENRYMVKSGLNNIKNMGIERILKSGKQDLFRLDGDSIGFTIAPIINGTARLGVIEDAIELLLSDDDTEVKAIRKRMNKANEKRKKMQKEIADSLIQEIDNTKKMVFIITEESSDGFNGLIAQDISSQLNKPVFVGREFKGEVRGSARSFGGFDMKTFMYQSGLVKYASGHEGAFGLGFDHDKLEDIYEYIDSHADDLDIKDPEILYDLELTVEEAIENIDLIEKFNKISGINADRIVLKVSNLTVLSRNVIGKTANTVKFETEEGLVAIKFRVDDEYATDVGAGDIISAVGNIKMNVFTKFYPKPAKQIKTPQIMMDDYKLEGSVF